ncbi:MAG: MBL fold metallo-hydrolase [Sphingobacteriia bacterium]|nr:MBL fold metallo-hydrolase [Sphingobacteriia bacterium]
MLRLILSFLALIINFNAFAMEKDKYKITDHFDGKRFYNQEPHTNTFGDFLKWQFTRKKPEWPEWTNENIKPSVERAVQNKIKATYVNHATVLIQVDGINILTDPLWSERASPLSFIGPKRIHAPGIEFEKLPLIDIVLISHDHYDHLDIPTMKRLHETFKPVFITGLKLGEYIKNIEKDLNVIELDWWEITKFKDLKIHFVPAHHWSSRAPFMRNKTLWGGFVVESKDGSVYFAGDTGQGKHFKQIAEKFSNIKLSLLPIGSYEPTWFMKYSHINPEEAVEAHILLKSKYSMGIHFNCLSNLADEEYNQPIIDLEKALAKNKISKDEFIAPKPGQELIIE